MLTILLAGLLTGFVISAPLGPMAALAALELSRGQKKAAFAIAAGVCIGDVLLAAASAGLLNIDFNMNVPSWLPVAIAALVLLVLAVWIWIEANKPVQPAAEGYKSFWSAIVVTLINPGNVAAYLALYSAVLPNVGLKTIEDLNKFETLGLLVATGVGLVLGWAAFLGAIMAAVERFGGVPKQLRPIMAKAVSVLMIVAAVLLVGLYVKGH